MSVTDPHKVIPSAETTVVLYKHVFGRKRTLCVSGIIGAGKTTLATKLAVNHGMRLLVEPVETNPYLKDFYLDKRKYGFAMQIYLLNQRYKLHQQMVWSDDVTIQDRSIYEDCIFAKMLHESGDISDLDFRTYTELFHNMDHFLFKPDLIIYLDAEPEVAKSRVTERGRECERDLPVEYLRALRAGYEDWLSGFKGSPVLRLDWNHPLETDEVMRLIEEML